MVRPAGVHVNWGDRQTVDGSVRFCSLMRATPLPRFDTKAHN